MREYSPKRRTALVLTGSGTSGAYHAGVLQGARRERRQARPRRGLGRGRGGRGLRAPWPAGAQLYGEGGFWDDVSWDAFYRLRAGAARGALLLLACSFGVFLLPVAARPARPALLFPLVLIVDLVAPGLHRAR